MKKISLNLILFVFLFTILGCKTHSFYYDCYDGDLSRVPLIEPYQVFSTNSGVCWFFSLTHDKANQMSNIDLIGIKDSVFVVHSYECFISGFRLKNQTATWCIVDSKSDKKYLYQDETEYRAKLDSLNTRDIKLYDVNFVFDKFKTTLKWPSEWPAKANSE